VLLWGFAHRAAFAVATLLPNLCHCLQGLLGGLSNVVECLRGEGAPPPAVRAVVHAALHYVDAELLNALVLRRDCCSISAIKALQVRNLAPTASENGVHGRRVPWLIACHQACMRSCACYSRDHQASRSAVCCHSIRAAAVLQALQAS